MGKASVPTLQTQGRTIEMWSVSLRDADFSARCGGAYIDIASRRHDFEGFGIDRRPGRSRSGIVHRRRHEGDAGLDIDAGAERPDIDINIRQRGHARADMPPKSARSEKSVAKAGAERTTAPSNERSAGLRERELNIWTASLGFPPPEIWGSQETRKRFPIGERRRAGKPSLADEPARNAILPWGLLFNPKKLCLPCAYFVDRSLAGGGSYAA